MKNLKAELKNPVKVSFKLPETFTKTDEIALNMVKKAFETGVYSPNNPQSVSELIGLELRKIKNQKMYN